MGAVEWMGIVPTIVALAHCIQSSLGDCDAGAGKNIGFERHCRGVRVLGPSPGKPRVGSKEVDTQLGASKEISTAARGLGTAVGQNPPNYYEHPWRRRG